MGAAHVGRLEIIELPSLRVSNRTADKNVTRP
jgi:hypothetical protein